MVDVKHVTDEVRALAARIIADSAAGQTSTFAVATGIERVFQQLHDIVANLVGTHGVSAVLRRALHLSKAECGWLETSTIVLEPLVVITGLETAIRTHGEERVQACVTLLLGHVIGLLCSFIGKDLTYRLLRTAWPALPTGEPPTVPEESKT